MADKNSLRLNRVLNRYAFALTFAVASLVVPALVHADDSGDEWTVVTHHYNNQSSSPGTSQAAPDASPAGTRATSPDADGVFVACGERARPAGEQYASIVASLNSMWGSHAKIYESVEPEGPHARGDCIFYNPEALRFITNDLMGVNDADHLNEMLYAINAHELGHIVHGDLTPARQSTLLETKELEADRFAGFTLWRLGIKRFDAAETEEYYKAVGDDFVGAHHSHGTAAQRTSAFQEGWDLARMGLRENATARPPGGMDNSE